MGSNRFVLKISGKLMIAAGFFLLAFIIFQIVVGKGLHNIGQKTSVFQKEQARGHAYIGEMLVAIDNLHSQYFSFLQNKSDGIEKVDLLNVSEIQQLISKGIGNESLPSYFKEIISSISLLTKQIGNQSLSSESSSVIIPDAFEKIEKQIQEMLKQGVSNAESFGAIMADNQKRIRSGMFVSMSVIFLIVLLIFVLIIRSLRIRIEKTLKFAEKIASGDLISVSENSSSGDEIGLINDSLEKLKCKLKDVLNSVKDISLNIMNASAEFNSGSQLISGGASAQASSSEEISAAMEQIAEVIKQSAENASETSKIAKNAYIGIQQGANHVEAAVAVIEDIAQKNSVIGEISYQTKILSINASVEAARAAEIGRGFAVVAEEVKRLAETSQKSASEISNVSKKGVNLARKSATELRELVSEFQRTSQLVDQITEASNEHITTIVQINYSLQDLNNITQQNASSAEELAASSNELVKLTHSLDDLISFFKLEEIKPEIENLAELNQEESVSIGEDNSFKRWESVNFSDDKEESKNVKDPEFYFPKVEPEEIIVEPSAIENKEEQSFVHKVIEPEKIEKRHIKQVPKEEKVKPHTKGVRINLNDNDDLDNQFEKMK